MIKIREPLNAQTGLNEVTWGQTGSNGVKQGQTGLNRVKQSQSSEVTICYPQSPGTEGLGALALQHP